MNHYQHKLSVLIIDRAFLRGLMVFSHMVHLLQFWKEALGPSKLEKLSQGTSKFVIEHNNSIFGQLKNKFSVVPRSRFLGDTSVPLPEFQRDICIFWGTQQIHQIFTCKIENSFTEISVHFYLNLSSMSIVLAQEVVQDTVK